MGNIRGFAYLVREVGLGALSQGGVEALFVTARGHPATNVLNAASDGIRRTRWGALRLVAGGRETAVPGVVAAGLRA
jgi:hypothetical protein